MRRSYKRKQHGWHLHIKANLFACLSTPGTCHPRIMRHPSTTLVQQLAGAIDPPPTSNSPTNQFSNCPRRVCRYNRDGKECGQPITCGTAPGHFRTIHGIRGMSRKVEISCKWPKCGAKAQRHSFMRHVRNVHLAHGERTNHQD
ncbi:hypothetical protein M404DRAFT_438717 [Pisolithus tinctorius Marx 270]|uniref:Uncharacterized protein n=1 Tax=Pisolithus tinctorius Marx 270 TaxID=870435 RepID=A0A0C3PEM9_PISTI|nr:hypothetical protein M404DRAFT_438717 [Pisolithus tinctorius Marx 270]